MGERAASRFEQETALLANPACRGMAAGNGPVRPQADHPCGAAIRVLRHCHTTYHGACALALLFAATPLPAADGLQLSTGFDYNRGKYGGDSPIEVAATVIQGRFERGPYVWQVTLPYLVLHGPGTLVGGGDSLEIVPAAGTQRHREAGFGDVVVSMNYAAFYDAQSGFALDVGGRIKLPTADSARGLGTGKSDLALRLQAIRTWDRTSWMLGVGYQWTGRPSGTDYRNVGQASLAADHRLNEDTSLGAIVDFRQSVQPSQPGQRELTLYLAHRLSRQWKIQTYVYGGASQSSPDIGFGSMLSVQF